MRDIERIKGSAGKEVFSEAKGLNIFKDKKVKIRRVLDEERQTLVYVSYSTRNTSQTDEGSSSGRY
ncbi:MAG: CreA family protein, partial [Cytophagales bacterium]|nr:CreA family protein [Cytophagales bacterium]